MSASIDQRIVSMRFDNQQFQNGVSDSLKSIDNLKKGLEFSSRIVAMSFCEPRS